MDHIKASEDSFGRANNYYILMWVMTALIVMIAIFNSHGVDLSEEGRRIVETAQRKFAYVMYKYLKHKHGDNSGKDKNKALAL